MRFFYLILGFILVMGASISCEQLSYDYNEIENNYEIIRDFLSATEANGVFVDDVLFKENGKLEILFSDNNHFIIKGNDLQLITIGINGRWYINEDPSNYSTEKQSFNDIVKQHNGYTDILYAISEEYETWTFHFIGRPSIIVPKTVYSRDFDSVILSINHRGYNVLAPENTLPAFRLARLKGFRYVETDVRFTADNIPVLLHDDSIDRTSDGKGKIRDLSFSQIRKFDFGKWKSSEYKGTQIPSLDEFLSLCKDIGLHPIIELKVGNDEQIGQIIQEVENYGLSEKTVYISFNPSLLKIVLDKQITATIAVLSSKAGDNSLDQIIGFEAQPPPILNSSEYDDDLVSKCCQLSIPLWVWTINSEERVLSLPKYISAVTSDSIHAGRIMSGLNK